MGIRRLSARKLDDSAVAVTPNHMQGVAGNVRVPGIAIRAGKTLPVQHGAIAMICPSRKAVFRPRIPCGSTSLAIGGIG